MNHFREKKHSADMLSSLLLFGVYVLFLLLMLLFAAGAYQNAVRGTEENCNLRTAMSYITVKIRQHDNGRDVFPGEIQNTPALCMTDEIDGKTYITYIYLYNGELKELFTAEKSNASLPMGTYIASLDSFLIEETPEHFFQIFMKDINGSTGEFLIHPGAPA